MATYNHIGKAKRVHFLCLSNLPSHAKRYVNNTKGITATLKTMCEISIE